MSGKTIDSSSRRRFLCSDDLNIVEMLGSGSFGSVYAVTLKHEKQSKSKPKYYALKILDKEKVYKENLARYALTERNVLSVAGKHPNVVSLDYAFQTKYRLYIIMEYCAGGDLGS